MKYSFRKRHILYALMVIVIAFIAVRSINCSNYVMKPTPQDKGGTVSSVPLDSESPWPRFRCNPLQNGRSNVMPEKSNLRPWTFQTGKGIFSSPVIDKDGTVYIGSADHHFYAIDRQGRLKWKYRTGEIIDSSALLDDKGRVYVGSGDGHVYAFDRSTGGVLWKFKAHTPKEVTEQFGIATYNLNWFEGNIAMLPDGTIIAPNDNYLIYKLDRDTGKSGGQFLINEMGWSLPAVNPVTGRIITGTNFLAVKNVYCFDAKTSETLWTNGGYGTNAASVMLTSADPDGAAIVGGYDGMVRAFGQKDGGQIWTFGARDHIYASPAQLADGTVIQASTDGTVYAIDPDRGALKWAFDTKEPVRSSPAIDGTGRIYFGSGDGRLFCLNPDGTLRWAYKFIDDVRNDLNASPALGRQGVYIAGESGGVFFMPYDYPLTETGMKDPKSYLGPGEDLPAEGAHLFYTSPFGSLELKAPKEIDANEPLCFTLFVRENGDTVKTAIDRNSVKIKVSGRAKARMDTSANSQFITVIPQEMWTGPAGGTMTVTIKGDYKRGMMRFGLLFFGGRKGGSFDGTFTFTVRPRKGEAMPYKIPEKRGDLSSVIEISRLAPANPSILPSYNQIGYDSLHYILGTVEGKGNRAVLWGVGGRFAGKGKETVIDPELDVRFPLMMEYDRGLLTLYNYDGILLDMNGAWDMPIAFYRLAMKVNPASGAALGFAALNAAVECDKIEFYRWFIKLLGMSEIDTGLMFIAGGADYGLNGGGTTRGAGAEGAGRVSFSVKDGTVSAKISGGSLKKKDHVYSLLLVSVKTGRPVPAKYIDATTVQADKTGTITGVSLDLGDAVFKGKARVYYMVDTYPAVKSMIDIR